MRVVRSFSYLVGVKGAVCSIGNFDGLHIGHKKLLDESKKLALKYSVPVLVLTFENADGSRHFLGKPAITGIMQKLYLLEKEGIDDVLIISFDKKFMSVSAKDFIESYLVRYISPSAVVVGYNFTFGKDREGTPKFLKDYSKKSGFDLTVIPKQTVNGAVVSSTEVRRRIKKADFNFLELMLGRKYSFFASVVKGRGVGKKIGFPTANLAPLSAIYPPPGVYAVDVRVGKRMRNGIIFCRKYRGVMNIGNRPTFSDAGGGLSLEVHLLGRKKSLEGYILDVIPLFRIRDEKKFASTEELSKAIKRDIAMTTNSVDRPQDRVGSEAKRRFLRGR